MAPKMNSLQYFALVLLAFTFFFLELAVSAPQQIYSAIRIYQKGDLSGVFTGAGAHPGARYCPGSYVINSEFWLYGGLGNLYENITTYPLNDVWKFTPSTRTWTYMNFPGTPTDSPYFFPPGYDRSIFPGERYCMVDRWRMNNGLEPVVFGGIRITTQNGLTPVNDVWTFNTNGGTLNWTRLWAPPNGQNPDASVSSLGPDYYYPGARSRAAAWRVGEVMYLFGGSGYATATSGYTNDMWMFFPANGTWVPIIPGQNDPYPGVRVGPMVWVESNRYLWMWGGLTTNSGISSATNELWKFDTTTFLWVQATQNGQIPEARYGAVAWTSSDNKLTFFGGNAYVSPAISQRNDMWQYDIGAAQWTKVTVGNADSSIPLPQLDSVGRWLDSNYTMWLFSGRSASGTSINEMWALDIDECAMGTHNCHPSLATCNNVLGGFTCSCNTGFSGNGVTCSNINECDTGLYPSPCAAHSTCTDTFGSFSCSPCSAGYSGDPRVLCVDNDECTPTNAYTNGQPACDSRTSCTNTDGGWTCSPCPAGFSGDPKYPNALRCQDVDECNNGTRGGCDSLVTCTNTVGSYFCGPCPSGYTDNPPQGTNCIDINECINPGGVCDPLAQCNNNYGGYTCGPCPSYKVGNGKICRDPPYINRTIPTLGNPSTIVTVIGANFTNNNLSCFVDNKRVTTTFISSTAITCAMADAALVTPGNYNIYVSQTNYQDTSNTASFNFYLQETVTALSGVPNSVMFSGQSYVVLGTNFLNIPTLTCRIVMTSSQVTYTVLATWLSSTSVRCQSPERIAGVSLTSVSNNGNDYPPGVSLSLKYTASFECSSSQESTLEQSVQNGVGIFEYFPNVAAARSGFTTVTTTSITPAATNQLFDGDRCCTSPTNSSDLGSCGVRWTNGTAVEIQVTFAKPLWVNEILTAFNTPCLYEPRETYTLSYKHTNGTWIVFKKRFTTEETCGSIKGEAGAVSLCIDFFDYIMNATAFKIGWQANERNTWMYEFEVHGIYLDMPYSIDIAPLPDVTIGNSVNVELPQMCVKAYNVDSKFITYTDSNGEYGISFSISPALNFVTNPVMTKFTNGQACFSLTAIAPALGVYTITFTSAKSTISSITDTISIFPGLAYKMSSPFTYYETAAVVSMRIPAFSIQLLDVLGNKINVDSNPTITASSPTGTVAGQLTATSSAGVATFTTLNMTSPTRGIQIINFNATGILGISVTVNVTAGNPHHLTITNSSTTATCDSTVAIPSFIIRVYDSGNGELTSYSSAMLFYLATKETLTGNATSSNAFPVMYTYGIVQGYLGLAAFNFTVESPIIAPPGPFLNVTVIPGAPRNMSINATTLSVDVTGPTITLPSIGVMVKDFCGNVPNVTLSTLTLRPLNATLVFLNGATVLTQDVTSGYTVVSMQFTTPLPGTYFINFEVFGVQTVVLTVNVIAGYQSKFSSPITTSTGSYQAVPDILFDPISFKVYDVQGNLAPPARITATTATVWSPTLNLTGTLTVPIVAATGTATFNNIRFWMAPAGNHSLIFSANNQIVNATFNVAITQGPPYRLKLTTTTLSAQCGSTITIPQLQVRVFDSGNTEMFEYNPLTLRVIRADTGATVTSIETSSFPFQVSGATVPGALGLTTFDITVSLDNSASLTDRATVMVTAGAPYNIFVSPNTATIAVANPVFVLPNSIAVTSTDYCGQLPISALPPVTVQSLDPKLLFMDGNSNFTISSWNGFTTPLTTPVAGNYVLSFSAAGLASTANFTLTITAGSPYQLKLSAFTSTYPAQPRVTLPTIIVSVKDLVGNQAYFNASLNLQVLISCPTATLDGPLQIPVASNSRASFSNVSLVMPPGGTHTLVFTLIGSSVSSYSANITITLGNPYYLKLNYVSPLVTTCEDTISIPSFTVYAYDSGNSELAANLNLRFYDNATQVQFAQMNAPTTPFTVSTLTISPSAGLSSFAVNVGASNYPVATDAARVTINPGTAHTLVLSSVSATVMVTNDATISLGGISMSTVDQCLNTLNATVYAVAHSNNAILKYLDGTNDANLAPMTGAPVSLTFQIVPAGVYTITFSSLGNYLRNSVVFTLTVVPGIAYKMATPVFTANYPAAVTIPMSIVTIKVLDVGGNVAAYNASATVLVDASSPDMALAGTLTASLDSSGDLVFNNIILNKPASGPHVLTFTSNPNSTIMLLPVTVNITIDYGAAYIIRPSAKLSYNTSVSCAKVSKFPVLNMTLYDAGDAFVTNSGINVTVSGTGMQLYGTTVVPVVLGVATFDNLWVMGFPGATGVVLTFSSPSLIAAYLNIILVPGDATSMTLTPSVTYSIIFTPGPYISVPVAGSSIQINLTDACGNAPASAVEVVTIVPGEETLSFLAGTTAYTVTTTNGYATSPIITCTAPSVGPHILRYFKDSLYANLTVNVLAGNEFKLFVNGKATLGLPSADDVVLPPLNISFGDVNSNAIPTKTNRCILATITYPNNLGTFPAGNICVNATVVNFALPLITLHAPKTGNYTINIASDGLSSATFIVTIYPGGANKLQVGFDVPANQTDANGNLLLKSGHNVSMPVVKIFVQDAGGYEVPFNGTIMVNLFVKNTRSIYTHFEDASLFFSSWDPYFTPEQRQNERLAAPELVGTLNISISGNTTVVVFDDLVLLSPLVGTYTLQFSSVGIEPPLVSIELTFSVSSGPPAALAVSVPSNVYTIPSKTSSIIPALIVVVVDELGQNTLLPSTQLQTVYGTLNSSIAYQLAAKPSSPVLSAGGVVSTTFTTIELRSPPAGEFSLVFSLNVTGLNQIITGSVDFTVVPGPPISLVIVDSDQGPLQSAAQLPLTNVTVCALDAGKNPADIDNQPINITAVLTLPEVYTIVNTTPTASPARSVWSNTTNLISVTGYAACTSFLDLSLISPKIGTYKLTFMANGISNTSMSIVVIPGDPFALRPNFNVSQLGLRDAIVKDADKGTQTTHMVLNFPPAFRLEDVSQNLVPTGVVDLYITPISKIDTSTMAGTTANVTSGIATFPNIAFNGMYDTATYDFTFVVRDSNVPSFVIGNLTIFCLPPTVPDTTKFKCVCGPGYYSDGGVCAQCPVNTFKIANADQCAKCPINTATYDQTGSINCTCNTNTYYANQSNTDPEGCVPCPVGAFCSKGSIIGNQAGYWRIPKTDEFVKCIEPTSCIENGCATGYNGTMCQVCTSGYAKKESVCQVCPKQSAVGWVVLVITIILVGGLILLLLSRSFTQKSSDTVIIKIVITHVQTIALLKSVIIDWRSIFSGVASFANIVLLNVELIPANCIVPMSTYIRFLLYVLFIPIGLIAPALYYAAEFVYFCFYKGRDRQRTLQVIIKKYSVVIATLNFIIYLTVTGKVLQMFQCSTTIGDNHYLNADISVDCDNSSEYKAWRRLAEAVLVLYSVGTPLGILGYMIYIAKTRGLVNKNRVYNLFADGFKPEFFFWEIVTNLRKFLFVIGTTMLYSDTTRQLVYLLVISLIGLCAHLIFIPHRWPKVFKIEMISYIIMVLTIIAGMWVAVSPSGDGFSFFLSIVTGLGNVLFVFGCIIVLARSGMQKLEDKIDWSKYGRVGNLIKQFLEKIKKKIDQPPSLNRVLLSSAESQASFNEWWYNVGSQERHQFENFLEKVDSFSRSPSMYSLTHSNSSPSLGPDKWYKHHKRNVSDIELDDSKPTAIVDFQSPHLAMSQDGLLNRSNGSSTSPANSPKPTRGGPTPTDDGSITDTSANNNNNVNSNYNEEKKSAYVDESDESFSEDSPQ